MVSTNKREALCKLKLTFEQFHLLLIRHEGAKEKCALVEDSKFVVFVNVVDYFSSFITNDLKSFS